MYGRIFDNNKISEKYGCIDMEKNYQIPRLMKI